MLYRRNAWVVEKTWAAKQRLWSLPRPSRCLASLKKTSMDQRKMYFLTISLAQSVGSVEKMAAHFGSGFFRAPATVSASGSLYPLTKTMIPSTPLRHATETVATWHPNSRSLMSLPLRAW